jgi:hypothetical protein
MSARSLETSIGSLIESQTSFPRAQHGVAVRPLRARDRASFDVIWCGALAAAERPSVGWPQVNFCRSMHHEVMIRLS